ncbi:RNA ligase/cyclic nucleotide phosphodiesterase [Pyronema omphalodes]|nr:RNA ligase/cyclic nucleotide phosphodiesterase [Pyronema omphalodes]
MTKSISPLLSLFWSLLSLCRTCLVDLYLRLTTPTLDDIRFLSTKKPYATKTQHGSMTPPPVEPVIHLGIGTDAVNSFEDLSGLSSKRSSKAGTPNNEFENPYDALIEACENDPAQIQKAYQTHRITRNANQRARLIASDFPGVTVDPILRELEYLRDNSAVISAFPVGYEKRHESAIDPRNCLVFWARPTVAVMDLIGGVQQRLKRFAPDLWIMPRDNLHLTVLEITHSTTEEFVATLVERMRPALQGIVDHPRNKNNRARLVKPLLSFDAAALAISFAPAEDCDYTYHHLRRDFYTLSKEAGVGVTSRYVVPSAHVTIARFVTSQDHEEMGVVSRQKMEAWMDLVWEINAELERWTGEWIVGEERGLDCRVGRLWYGGGETVVQAEGF